MQPSAKRTDDAAFEELVVSRAEARAVVRRSFVEQLCEGHFPGAPVVPGAYLVGLLATVATALMTKWDDRACASNDPRERPRLLQIDSCTFALPVDPEERVEVIARFATRSDCRRVEAEVRTRGARAVRAMLSFGWGT